MKQWLRTVVAHWGVETTHQILDTAFAEDERPWVTHSANGARVVFILRRLAYTLLALYRKVTQRADAKRREPWRRLMNRVTRSLTMATAELVYDIVEKRATS